MSRWHSFTGAPSIFLLASGLFSPGLAPVFAANSADLITAPVVLRDAAANASGLALSANGQRLFFLSTAQNLVTNHFNPGVLQLFVADTSSGALSLVSINSRGIGGNGPSYAPTTTADGGWVAFSSDATDLVTNDTNGVTDIFVRDLATASTRLISRGTNGSSANGASTDPVITPSGRFVFFESAASNLVPGATNYGISLFRADLSTGEIVMASTPADSTNSIPIFSTQAQVSDDGTRLIYLKNGGILTGPNGITGRGPLVYRDLIAQTSLTPLALADSTCTEISSSSDGTVAAVLATFKFDTGRTGGVYRVEFPSGATQLLSPNSDTVFRTRHPSEAGPTVSADGSVILFEAAPRGFFENAPPAVYAWDNKAAAATLLSTNTVLAPGQRIAPFGEFAGMSSDGRFVAWLGYATSGIVYPSNQPLSLFVLDRVTGERREILPGSVSATPLETDHPMISFSSDGQLAAFQSASPDVLDRDHTDIFLYHWDSHQVDLISAATRASATTAGFQSVAGGNSISADGRFLVFTSARQGWTTNDLNRVPNVFVRDLVTGSNQLVSVDFTGAIPANGLCRQAVISADGHWVAFTSRATNLSANDTNQVDDVFLRDLSTLKTYLVSHNLLGASANAPSWSPDISADGAKVFFSSLATNLVAGDSNVRGDFYIFDRSNGTVHSISSGLGANGSSRDVFRPVLSPDGAWVVFESSPYPSIVSGGQIWAWQAADGSLRQLADNAGRGFQRTISFSGNSQVVAFDVLQILGPAILVHDFASANTFTAVTKALAPSLNFDASLAAFLVSGSGTQQQVEIIRRDSTLATNIPALVSVGTDAIHPANARCFAPLLTPNGRFVVFASQADNLVASDTNQASDVFVRDLTAGTTLCLSRSFFSTNTGNALSSAPILGRDGRTLLFTSFASDLAENDFNEAPDLFVVRLPGPESDFRITTVMRLSTREVHLAWPIRQGATYRIEFTDNVTSGWQPLPASVQINGDQAAAIDADSTGHRMRFYRLIESP